MVKRFLAQFALLALLVQAMIPFGFMPDTDKDTGKLVLEICTAHGKKFVEMDVSQEDNTDAPTQERPTLLQDHCPFAPLSQIAIHYPPLLNQHDYDGSAWVNNLYQSIIAIEKVRSHAGRAPPFVA